VRYAVIRLCQGHIVNRFRFLRRLATVKVDDQIVRNAIEPGREIFRWTAALLQGNQETVESFCCDLFRRILMSGSPVNVPVDG